MHYKTHPETEGHVQQGETRVEWLAGPPRHGEGPLGQHLEQIRSTPGGFIWMGRVWEELCYQLLQLPGEPREAMPPGVWGMEVVCDRRPGPQGVLSNCAPHARGLASHHCLDVWLQG